MSRKATGELKNVQAGACQVFLRGVSFRHQGGRDRRQSASAASESVLGPEIPVFYGDVSSTIASSTLPPGRLIVRVLSSGCEASRATRHHAERSHRAHHSHAGKKQLREAKRSASIRSMRRWVWPIADATRALKAAIRGSVAKAATATLRYEAFEARHCMRRLTPATLGVHLRDLFAMNRNRQRHEY